MFFTALVCSSVTFSQDFRADYKKMQDKYGSLEKFSCKLKVNVSEDQKPAQTLNYAMKKSGEDFWYSMDKIKMIVNSNCVLYINDEEKQLVYTVRNKKKELPFPSGDLAGAVDTLLKKSDSVVFAGLRDNCKKYIIYSSAGEIIRSEIYINNETSLITRVAYHYKHYQERGDIRVDIAYQEMNTAPQFANSEFSEKQYVSYNRGVARPLGKYSSYQASVVNENDIK
jgi:hypothetical protein